MIRKIIHIDSKKCNGCGLCVSACHEGAIGMRNGKAVLLRDDYCDGLGDCLPVCPTKAISFEEREALAYDEAAVQKKIMEREKMQEREKTQEREKIQEREKSLLPCGCPASVSRELPVLKSARTGEEAEKSQMQASCLRQWPVQLRLVSPHAAFLQHANLLIAADCTAYACGSFHQQFMAEKVTLIACPKLDAVDYAEKLIPILENNNIASIVVVKMSVPCCQEIAKATLRAIQKSGKHIPLQVVTLSPEGELVE